MQNSFILKRIATTRHFDSDAKYLKNMRQLSLFTALQSITEGIDTEFNSARGGMPGSFWESYATMANTQGGTIVLGVADAVQLR